MSLDQFKDRVEGTINDFVTGLMTEREFKESMLETLIEVASPHLERKPGDPPAKRFGFVGTFYSHDFKQGDLVKVIEEKIEEIDYTTKPEIGLVYHVHGLNPSGKILLSIGGFAVTKIVIRPDHIEKV